MLCRNDEPATRHLVMGCRQRREVCGAASSLLEWVGHQWSWLIVFGDYSDMAFIEKNVE